MSVSGIPETDISGTIPEVRLKVDMIPQSYRQGHLPASWTRATVCQYQKGKCSLPENYRPISLTAIPCKLFEHILVSQIWDHLHKHNIITSNQHVFRKSMSCETQLIQATFDWTTILNKGQGQIDVILLDFSKAFDVIPHQTHAKTIQLRNK